MSVDGLGVFAPVPLGPIAALCIVAAVAFVLQRDDNRDWLAWAEAGV
jgi:hypothetical protein